MGHVHGRPAPLALLRSPSPSPSQEPISGQPQRSLSLMACVLQAVLVLDSSVCHDRPHGDIGPGEAHVLLVESLVGRKATLFLQSAMPDRMCLCKPVGRAGPSGAALCTGEAQDRLQMACFTPEEPAGLLDVSLEPGASPGSPAASTLTWEGSEQRTWPSQVSLVA